MINTLRAIKRTIHSLSAPGGRNRSRTDIERIRLAALPRYVETITDLPGTSFKIPDAASFLASWSEIFDNKIYDFKCDSDQPRIVDCGANVGVSCLYFQRRFPLSRITAFEPDPKIFSYLAENMERAGYSNIQLIKKAVWTSETILKFEAEGSDSGRINGSVSDNTIDVGAVRLRDYLDEKVDFLKMDIEGAECEVIADISSLLSNVENIFVEYHSFTGKPQKLEFLIKTLSESGFRLQIHHVCVSPRPFIEVKSNFGMDMQLNIFGYRS